MEVKQLQGFVILIVLVGMLLGVGIMTFDRFSRAIRLTTTIQDDNVNLSSQSATLSQTFCLTVTSMTNTSGQDYPISTNNVTFINPDTCVLFGTPPVYMRYNVTYTYGASTAGQTTMDNLVTAVNPIATTWMPLIVTVSVLAIILGLVISSFTARRK